MAAGGGTQGTNAFASTLTDLMTSLAVIFILLLVVFLKQASDQSKKAKNEVREELNSILAERSLALVQDPEDPLTLSVTVDESQLRFPVNSSQLSKQGGEFVEQFFRNFAARLCKPGLRDKIDAIVIEGHTDQSGEQTRGGVRRNIALSQKRSYSVLDQALKGVEGDSASYECLLTLASASGRGSRRPVLVDGAYDFDKSRRVEIKIRVRSAEQQFKDLITSTGGAGK